MDNQTVSSIMSTGGDRPGRGFGGGPVSEAAAIRQGVSRCRERPQCVIGIFPLRYGQPNGIRRLCRQLQSAVRGVLDGGPISENSQVSEAAAIRQGVSRCRERPECVIGIFPVRYEQSNGIRRLCRQVESALRGVLDGRPLSGVPEAGVRNRHFPIRYGQSNGIRRLCRQLESALRGVLDGGPVSENS